MPGWTRAARIVVPASELQPRPASGTPGRPVTEIPVSGEHNAAVIGIWLEALHSPSLAFDARLVGQLRRAAGGNVWVTAHEMALPWILSSASLIRLLLPARPP